MLASPSGVNAGPAAVRDEDVLFAEFAACARPSRGVGTQGVYARRVVFAVDAAIGIGAAVIVARGEEAQGVVVLRFQERLVSVHAVGEEAAGAEGVMGVVVFTVCRDGRWVFLPVLRRAEVDAARAAVGEGHGHAGVVFVIVGGDGVQQLPIAG